jgi:hypothetical protein
MPESKSRRKKSPKRILALPDLEHAKTAVLNSLTSVPGGRTGERGSGSENGPSVTRRHPTNVSYRRGENEGPRFASSLRDALRARILSWETCSVDPTEAVSCTAVPPRRLILTTPVVVPASPTSSTPRTRLYRA